MTAERRPPSLHKGDRVVVHVDGVATTTVATVQFTKSNQWGLVNAFIVGEHFATWVTPQQVASDPRFDPTSPYQVHPAPDEGLCQVRVENATAEVYGTGEMALVSYTCLRPMPCDVHPADDSVTPVTELGVGDEVSHDEAVTIITEGFFTAFGEPGPPR